MGDIKLSDCKADGSKVCDYKIRAHHGMCLAFFEGKGYSSEFTIHMGKMKQLLSENPEVYIFSETDDICSSCPNNKEGVCLSEGKVKNYDSQVLALCGLQSGTGLLWKDFEKLVETNVLNAGKRKDICGGCQWNYICENA